MNITVYCGASFGNDPDFSRAAHELGTWIGENGHALAYGGSSVGLMGLVADATLKAGGAAFGVEPTFFIEQDVQHNGLTHLYEVETMSQRKALMIELGDAFVALPGGIGTLEEISEIASRVRLGLTVAPCILLNLNGFYDTLEACLEHMADSGFLPRDAREKVLFATSLSQVYHALEQANR